MLTIVDMIAILRPDSAIYDIKIQEADTLFQLSSTDRIDRIGLKGSIKRYSISTDVHNFHKFKILKDFSILDIAQRFSLSSKIFQRST